jgi:hypothetical protein
VREATSLRDCRPGLVDDLALLLQRAGRADLVPQLQRAGDGRERGPGSSGRRSFFASERRGDYSLEFDTRHGTVLLDVSEVEGIVAVHLLSDAD